MSNVRPQNNARPTHQPHCSTGRRLVCNWPHSVRRLRRAQQVGLGHPTQRSVRGLRHCVSGRACLLSGVRARHQSLRSHLVHRARRSQPLLRNVQAHAVVVPSRRRRYASHLNSAQLSRLSCVSKNWFRHPRCGCGLTLPSSGLAPAAQAWPSFHSGPSPCRLREPLMSNVGRHKEHVGESHASSCFRAVKAGCSVPVCIGSAVCKSNAYASFQVGAPPFCRGRQGHWQLGRPNRSCASQSIRALTSSSVSASACALPSANASQSVGAAAW